MSGDDPLLVIGTPAAKVDGLTKSTGQEIYADDIDLPQMLYGKMLGATVPHARIRSIDVSRAEALPGVKAIITGIEMPIKYGILPVSEDEYPLEIDRVRFVGDPVAAVAAVDEATAEEAVRLIEVEYDELPGTFDIDEGLQPVEAERTARQRAQAGPPALRRRGRGDEVRRIGARRGLFLLRQ